MAVNKFVNIKQFTARFSSSIVFFPFRRASVDARFDLVLAIPLMARAAGFSRSPCDRELETFFR